MCICQRIAFQFFFWSSKKSGTITSLMQNNLRNSKMVITALPVAVLLAEHRWQEMPSSGSSLLGNLNQRSIQPEMGFRGSVVQLPAQSKRLDQIAQGFVYCIVETLKDRDYKASGQAFLMLDCPQSEKVFLICWVKLMFQLMFIKSSSYHVLLKEPIWSCLPSLR